MEIEITTDCDYEPMDLTVLVARNEKGQIIEIKTDQLDFGRLYIASENLTILRAV